MAVSLVLYVDNPYDWLLITATVAYPIQILFFILSWFADAGKIAKNKDIGSAVQWLAENEANKICPDCLVLLDLILDL